MISPVTLTSSLSVNRLKISALVLVLVVEIIKEVPVEVIKEVPIEVIKEIIKEVPVEIIREVIKEVPVEVIKEIVKIDETEIIRLKGLNEQLQKELDAITESLGKINRAKYMKNSNLNSLYDE